MTNQTEQPQPTPAPAPEQKMLTIAELKQAVCKKLTQIFSSDIMQERLLKMAGGDASRVAKNLTSYLATLTQDEGSGKRSEPKKFYVQCSMTSLTMCFLESMNMQLPFDSRKLVSLVIYDWEVELDISYKGFINALNKHYDNAFVDAHLVFDDDQFECEESGGTATFKHVAKNPFRTVDKDFTGIAGGYCYFSYTTKSSAPVSRIVRMSRDDILKIKSKAKTAAVWEDFPSEMGIKAIIRRGSKIPFAAIDLDLDIEEVANRHFVLDKAPSHQRLENLMKAQEEVTHGTTKPQGKEAAGDAGTVPEKTPQAAEAPAGAADGESGAVSGHTAADREDQNESAGEAPAEDQAKPEITDADFETLENDGMPQPDPEDPGAGNTTAADAVSDQAVWDGKTLFVGGGKSTAKDFVSSVQALVYLKKVIGQRKTKASRKEIIDRNSMLIAALIKDKQGSAVADLHKLADQGE